MILDQSTLIPGAVLNCQYRILGLTAKGAFASVYTVRNMPAGEVQALKLRHRQLADDQAALARFNCERSVLGRVSHPNVVTLLDSADADAGGEYYTMEMLDGGSLAKRIYANAPMRLEVALDILLQIASALSALHGQGFVHRNLKPENILFSRSGTAKLAGFNLAFHATSPAPSDDIAGIVGTPYYMAPEQFRTSQVDARADIYALGILAFEMVARRRPFDPDTFFMMARCHQAEHIPGLSGRDSDIPRWFDTLVGHCCEKRPENRFQSADEVIYTIEKNIAKRKRPKDADGLPPPTPLTRWLSRLIALE